MFWIVTAIISVLVIIWVAYPLFRVKQETGPDLQSVNAKLLEDQLAELDNDLAQGTLSLAQFEAAKLDLQRTFLDTAKVTDINPVLHEKGNPLVAIVVAIFLPVGAYLVYDQVGTDYESIKYVADQVNSDKRTAEAGEVDPHSAAGGVDVAAMVEKVRLKAEANPNDLESWGMLARSLHIMRDYDGAGRAYLHLINRGAGDAEIYSRYADILATKAGGILLGSPAYQWTLKALEMDPNHQQALWIAGTAAYYSRDYDLAEKYWKHLLSILEPGTDTYNSIEQNLKQIEMERPQ